MVAKTVWSMPSICTRNMVLGSDSTISPSTSIFSSFWAIYLTETALAEATGALVAVEDLDQEVLVGVRRGVDHAAFLEAEADAGDLPARVDGGELGEGDRPGRRVLERRVEELPARHVGAAGVDLA